MQTGNRNYSIFYQYIETYCKSGFKWPVESDRIILSLEEQLDNNEQFFFVGDILHMKILFTSKRSTHMLGVSPEELTPYHFREAVHPDDVKRHGTGTAQLFKIATELYNAKEGKYLLSTNLRFRNPVEGYSNLLIQCYLFYSDVPYKTVFILQVMTNIDWFKKLRKGYHYYVGNDMSLFRYPDKKLLLNDRVFSDREFEIIKLIHSGLNTEQIAEKLFLSKHTVNTHRYNILKKSGKVQISDLIYDLQEKGYI